MSFDSSAHLSRSFQADPLHGQPRFPLQLQRPLVALDLETTGVQVQSDKILEIACIKIDIDGRQSIKEYLLNPGMPIPENASAIHGIKDSDVMHCPLFADIAQELADWLEGCDFLGYNIEKFDLLLLSNEFSRCGLQFPNQPYRCLDSFQVFKRFEPHSLQKAYQFYCHKELENAHRAMQDTKACLDVFIQQVQRYQLPANVEQLHQQLKPKNDHWIDSEGKLIWQGNQVILTFGRYKQQTLHTLISQDRAYAEWIAHKANFSQEVVQIVREALDGRFPKKSGLSDLDIEQALEAADLAVLPF